MTESVGVVVAALIAALTFTVGEIIRVRERRRDQIATRVAEVQLAVRAFTLEAVRSEARDEAVQLKTAMHATGAITSLLAVVPKRDRGFVMR
ncbi:hypothetical protein [Microbacterium sp. NPDC087868]|uniref:hypothetical protein n=1 Tax=Microbacterium sp. NPDC087868 TaxID=3364195 RepID=UPI00384E3AF1